MGIDAIIGVPQFGVSVNRISTIPTMNNTKIDSASDAKLRQLRDSMYQARDIRDHSTWAERDEAVARLIAAEGKYEEALLDIVARNSRD